MRLQENHGLKISPCGGGKPYLATGLINLISVSKSVLILNSIVNLNEPHRDKTNKMVCAPSENTDRPGHPHNLISLRYALSGKLRTLAFFMRTAKTLIRLGGCPDRSESSLGAHAILLVLSQCGSN